MYLHNMMLSYMNRSILNFFKRKLDKSNLKFSPSEKHKNCLISILSSDDEGAARGPTRDSLAFFDCILFFKTQSELLWLNARVNLLSPSIKSFIPTARSSSTPARSTPSPDTSASSQIKLDCVPSSASLSASRCTNNPSRCSSSTSRSRTRFTSTPLRYSATPFRAPPLKNCPP